MIPISNYVNNTFWEDKELTKDQYISLLKNLNQKNTRSSFIIQNHSLRIVNSVMCIWETVKGWFGFENNANPIKINYELLKLLQYGEDHYFIEDKQVIDLLNKLRSKLDQDKNYNKISSVIQRMLFKESGENKQDKTFTLSDEIKKYHGVNKNELSESFWPRVFHTYVKPIEVDETWRNYNIGRQNLIQGKFEEAISFLKKAHEASPEKTEWQFLLAKAYLGKAMEIESSHGNENLVAFCDSTLDILEKLKNSNRTLEHMNKLQEMTNKALALKFAYLGKEEAAGRNFEKAIHFFKEAIKIDPEKHEWHFFLAKAIAAFLFTKETISIESVNAIISDCNIILEILSSIPKTTQIMEPEVKELQQKIATKKALSESHLNYLLGNQSFAARNFEEAIAFLKKVQPETPESLLLLAKCYLSKADGASTNERTELIEDDISYCNIALSILIRLIPEFIGSPKYAEEIDNLKRETISKREAKESLLRYHQGNQYLTEKKFEDAIACLEKALASSSAQSIWQISLAKAYYAKADHLASLDGKGDLVSVYDKIWEHILDILSKFKLSTHSRLFLESVNQIEIDTKIRKNSSESLLKYRDGLRAFKEEKFEDAISFLESALKLTPEKPEWKILLAQAYLNKTKLLARKEEILTAYDKVLDIISEISSQEAEKIKEDATKKKVVLLANSGNIFQAFQTLKEMCNLSLINQFLNSNFHHYLRSQLTQENYGKLMLELAEDQKRNENPLGAVLLTAKAIDPLFVSNHDKADYQISERLIRAYLYLAQQALIPHEGSGGQIDVEEAALRIDGAYFEYEFLLSFYAPAIKSPVAIELIQSLRTFAEKQRENNDFSGSLGTMRKIENLLKLSESENRSILAEIYFTKALTEEKNKNFFQSIIEAEEAYRLDRSKKYEEQYTKLLDQISESIKTGPVRIPEEILDSFTLSLERIIDHSPNKTEWNFLLAKLHIKKIEQLRKSKNNLKAKLLNDKALGLLQQLSASEMKPYVEKLIAEAYVVKMVLQVDLAEISHVSETLQTAARETQRSYGSILEDYLIESAPVNAREHVQVGDLYMFLANDPNFSREAKIYLEEAIEQFKCAINEKFDAVVYQKLITCYLDRSKLELNGNIRLKEDLIINNGLAYYHTLKEAAPQIAFLPSLNSMLIVSINALVEEYITRAEEVPKGKDDSQRIFFLQGAIRNVKRLKEMTPKSDRGESARYCFILAKLEYQTNNYYNALQEADEAHTLDPATKEYKSLVEQYLSDFETQAQLSDNFFKEKDFERSLQCYLHCYKNKIQNFPARTGEIIGHLIQLAEIVQENNSALAAKAFEQVIPYFSELSISPEKQISILKLIADEYRKAGNFTEAIPFYQKGQLLLKQQDPRRLEFINNLISCHEGNCNTDAVEEIWQKALAQDPNNPSFHYAIGNHFEKQEKYHDALKAYDMAYSLQSNNKEYRKKLITAELHAGDQCYTTTITLEDLNSQVRNFVSTVLQNPSLATALTKSIDDRWLKKVLFEHATLTSFRKLGNKSNNPHVDKDKILAEAQEAVQTWEALTHSKVYQTLDPETRKDMEKRSGIIQTQKDHLSQSHEEIIKAQAEEAIPHYLRACALSGQEYGDSFNKLIQAYVENGDYTNAIASYEKYKAQFKQLPVHPPIKAYIDKMYVYLKQNKHDEAIQWIIQAYNTFPDTIIKNSVIDCMILTGKKFSEQDKNYVKAISYFKKASEFGADQRPDYHCELGLIYQKAEHEKIDLTNGKATSNTEELLANYSKAEELFRTALRLDPKNAYYHYILAKHLTIAPNNIVKRLEALKLFKKAVDIDPSKIEYVYGWRKVLRELPATDGDTSHRKKDTDKIELLYKQLNGDTRLNYFTQL